MDDDSDLLDPRQLLVFAEVARHGSLAAAAKALGWTQPAVAQHVKDLERDTGCLLVIRNSRGVTLTEAGRSLAAFPSACATFVPAAIALLGARAPGLDIRLTEAEPEHAQRLLAAAEVDLAITFDYDNVPHAPTPSTQTPLFDDPILLVVPGGDPLARRPNLALIDAAERRWIAGCPACRAHLTTAAAGHGFRPDIRHSTDDYIVTQTLVAAGLGVALLPSLALEAARDPDIATIEIEGHQPRHVILNSAADRSPSPATTATATALIEVTSPRRLPAGDPFRTGRTDPR